MRSHVVIPHLGALETFARGLAVGLRAGDTLTLSGPVGAGKTTLVRALVYAVTGFDGASSPSFTFWQRYDGRLPIHHIDLYRLEDANELSELGLHEAFDDHSLTLIEWPERAPQLIPSNARKLVVHGAGDEAREIEIESPS